MSSAVGSRGLAGVANDEVRLERRDHRVGATRRLGVQADVVVGALDQARINTLPLWDVDKVNGGVRSIIKSAQEARSVLGGGQ